jgi:hypothetical protein
MTFCTWIDVQKYHYTPQQQCQIQSMENYHAHINALQDHYTAYMQHLQHHPDQGAHWNTVFNQLFSTSQAILNQYQHC